MSDLDERAQTTPFFRHRNCRSWINRAYGHLYRAVEALDGEILPPTDDPIPDRVLPRIPPEPDPVRSPYRRDTGRKGSPRAWSPKEDATLAKHFPDHDTLHEKLPKRSRSAIVNRASLLCLSPHRRHWTAGEVGRLRKLYGWAPVETLIAAFPGRSLGSIKHIANGNGLRRPGLLKPIGHPLFDLLRKEARAQGYSMAQLDRLARSRTCFFNMPSGWRRMNHGALGRAAEVLKVPVQLRWN